MFKDRKFKIKNFKKPYVDAEEYMEDNRLKDKQMMKKYLERYKTKHSGLKGSVF